MALQLDADGWTEFPLHGSARAIYVSAAGNDSNDGLTPATAKLTIVGNAGSAKFALRTGFGDHLLLRRGDTFTGANYVFGNRNNGSGVKLRGHSEDFPLVIGAYGDEALPRPIVEMDGGTFFSASGGDGSGDGNDWALVSIDFVGRADGGAHTEPRAVFWNHTATGLTIEDCRSRWFFTAFDVIGVTGLRIRRNVVHEQYSVNAGHSQGIYLSSCTNITFEGNVADHNGYTTAGRPSETAETIFRHGLYLQDNCSGTIVARDNWSSRASAQALSIRTSADVYWNCLWRNPTGLTLVGSATSKCYENVCIDGRTTVYESGADGWQLSMTNTSANGWEISDNIVSGWVQGTRAVAAMIWTAQTGAGEASGNIVYNYPNVQNGAGPNDVGDVSFVGNDVQIPDLTSSYLVSIGTTAATSLLTFGNNRFHSGATASAWFRVNGANRSFAQFVSDMSDGTSTATQVSYADPGRDYERYWAEVCGGAGGMDGFLTAMRNRRKGDWDSRLQPKHMVWWIAQGYGRTMGEALPSSGSESNAKRTRLTVSIGVGL